MAFLQGGFFSAVYNKSVNSKGSKKEVYDGNYEIIIFNKIKI